MASLAHVYPPRIVLSFGSSDPSGGAGIQGDVLTCAALGAHAVTVLTALTARDTSAVEAMQPVDSEWVADQARSLLEDMPVHAFKIGVLGGIENVAVIAEVVADYPDIPLVFDPDLAAGQSDPLADEEMHEALCDLLVPLASVLTCDSTEILQFCGGAADEREATDAAECARQLLAMGARHVLVTGAHEQTPQVVNTLFGASGLIRADAWERLAGRYHGAGSTLSAAIAALLARGVDLSDAVGQAQQFVWHALAHGWRLGMGRTVPNRFRAVPDA